MRKLSSIMSAAVMLAATLVAFSGGAANAEPYPGSIDTTCFGEALNNPRVDGDAALVRFRVGTGGNGPAKGIVTFSYERRSNGAVIREFTRRYQGPGWDKHGFTNVPRGRYVVRVFFNSTPGDSVYQNCRTNFRQRIYPAA